MSDNENNSNNKDKKKKKNRKSLHINTGNNPKKIMNSSAEPKKSEFELKLEKEKEKLKNLDEKRKKEMSKSHKEKKEKSVDNNKLKIEDIERNKKRELEKKIAKTKEKYKPKETNEVNEMNDKEKIKEKYKIKDSNDNIEKKDKRDQSNKNEKKYDISDINEKNDKGMMNLLDKKEKPSYSMNTMNDFKDGKDVFNLPSGTVIAHNFVIIAKIGKGSFGVLYAAVEQKSQKQAAIKIEEKYRDTLPVTLKKEANFLYEIGGSLGFPKMYYFTHNNKFNILIMTLLGKNLENLHKRCKKNFSLHSTIVIAEQLITRLETLHSKGILHRDLKPENLMVAFNKSDKFIYLVDFGLSKKFLEKDGKHIPFKENIGMIGTPRYTSKNSHLGYEQSRRDDLESLGYILVFFNRGVLPWMNMKDDPAEKNKKICKMKCDLNLNELCHGMPVQFQQYFHYVRSLQFEEAPDYNYLRSLFQPLHPFKNNKIPKISGEEEDLLSFMKVDHHNNDLDSMRFGTTKSKLASNYSYCSFLTKPMTNSSKIIYYEDRDKSQDSIDPGITNYFGNDNSLIASPMNTSNSLQRNLRSHSSNAIHKDNVVLPWNLKKKESPENLDLSDGDEYFNSRKIRDMIYFLENTKVRVMKEEYSEEFDPFINERDKVGRLLSNKKEGFSLPKIGIKSKRNSSLHQNYPISLRNIKNISLLNPFGLNNLLQTNELNLKEKKLNSFRLNSNKFVKNEIDIVFKNELPNLKNIPPIGYYNSAESQNFIKKRSKNCIIYSSRSKTNEIAKEKYIKVKEKIQETINNKKDYIQEQKIFDNEFENKVNPERLKFYKKEIKEYVNKRLNLNVRLHKSFAFPKDFVKDIKKLKDRTKKLKYTLEDALSYFNEHTKEMLKNREKYAKNVEKIENQEKNKF